MDEVCTDEEVHGEVQPEPLTDILEEPEEGLQPDTPYIDMCQGVLTTERKGVMRL